MKIDRALLLEQLNSFTQEGNGLIIGKPGIGKSYALSQLSDLLWDKKVPNFIIKVDETDGTDEAFSQELELEGDWVAALNKVSMPDESSKAIFIIDAFDAVRDEALRKSYLALIKKAIRGLSATKWNVIVSVRTYDATKSPQLIKLFPYNKSLTSHPISCRFMAINDLNDNELDSAFEDNITLQKAFSFVTNDLRQVLKNPFFLRLFEIVLEGLSKIDLNKIKIIKSETELLDIFWHRKIVDTEESYQKETYLKELASKLVVKKTLSISKDNFITTERLNTFKDLRSNDIINEVGVNERNISFTHNIFFDYAVGRLIIPTESKELLEFISSDKSRPFFLRPSFIYHFTSLWYHQRDLFWINYQYLTSQTDPNIILFQRLLMTTVVANEFEETQDVEPIFENSRTIQWMLQSIRFLSSRRFGERDVNFLSELSVKLSSEFVWDFASVFYSLLKERSDNVDLQKEDLWDNFGLIARNFLKFIFEERKRDSLRKFSLDRLGSTRGVSFVSETYATNIQSSKSLLREVLNLLKEPGFEIWYLSVLCDSVKHFLEHDPHFVSEIYKTIFSHKEDSEDKTNMGTVTLTLISNRRQDFDMCYYRLVEFFPNFLNSSPEIAIQTGIEIVNSYVINEELQGYNLGINKSEVTVQGIKSEYVPDLSSMWHDMLVYHKPAQLESKIIDYFRTLINNGENEILTKAVHVYLKSAKVGLIWKKFIEFANESPAIFIDYLYDLSLNKIILTSSDTTYEIGISLQKIASLLTKQKVKNLERNILDLLKTDAQENVYVEHKVKRLLNCIPSHLLTLKKSLRLVSENPVLNEPVFKSHFSSEPYTTDKWLEDKGVDLNEQTNKKIYDLLSQLQTFNRQWQNISPNREIFSSHFATGLELFKIATEEANVNDELVFSALEETAKYFSIISRDHTQLNDAEYISIKEVITYCLSYISKYDKEEDSSSASSGYSPTPRIEASSALVGLLRYRNEDEIFNLIKKYIKDLNAVIRFNVSRNISQVWMEREDEFWTIIFERLENETDSFTLGTLIYNIYRTDIIEKNEAQIIKAIEICEEQISRRPHRDTFMEAYVLLLLFLLDKKSNPSSKQIIYNNLVNTEFARVVLWKSFEFIDPKYRDNDYSVGNIHDELIKILEIITNQSFALLKDIDLNEIKEESLEKERLLIIDTVIQRIYFTLDINERIGRNEPHPTEGNKRFFYKRIKNVILNVIKGSRDVGSGIILGHTAHYMIETLNGIVDFYPEETEELLSMIVQITELARVTGYTFDSTAVKEMVSFTEKVLADHKDILAREKTLDNIISLLNIYVESGWPEALNLLWKMDEAFK